MPAAIVPHPKLQVSSVESLESWQLCSAPSTLVLSACFLVHGKEDSNTVLSRQYTAGIGSDSRLSALLENAVGHQIVEDAACRRYCPSYKARRDMYVISFVTPTLEPSHTHTVQWPIKQLIVLNCSHVDRIRPLTDSCSRLTT